MATAADVIGSTDDLMTQILLCLPVKSLMRFKLVSQHWKSLITSPRFSILRYPSPNPVVGLFWPDHKSSLFEYIPLDVKNPTKPPVRALNIPGDYPNILYRIRQSCNGLLLCCIPGSSCNSLVCSCCVYNPTTKCLAQLPGLSVPRNVCGVNLAFDPAKSLFYKVVCVRSLGFSYQIEVYSSESGAWRVSGEPFTVNARFDYGVYWNGSILWVGYDCSELFYFNVDDEKTGTMPLPISFSSRGTSVAYIGESLGNLLVVESCAGQVAFDVYEMRRGCSEWSVKCRSDPMTMVAEFTNIDLYMIIISGGFKILALVQVEGKCSFMVLWACGKLIRLNLDSNTLEELFEPGTTVISYMSQRAWEHIESLAGV